MVINKQAGMTLLEVLVALVILITGLFGAIAMQSSAKKGSFDAMQRSLASSLAQDIFESMRNNNPDNLALYSASSPYGTGKISNPPTCDSQANACSDAEVAKLDLYNWEQSLMGKTSRTGNKAIGGLNEPIACINVNTNAVTVIVTWKGREETSDGGANCGVASSSRRSISIEGFIF